jgi:ABC-type phosphate transport system substrate-binding protein
VFEHNVLQASEGVLSSNDCNTRDRDPNAKITRCERDPTADAVRAVSRTRGAIGYADTGSLAKAPEAGDVTALVLDGRIPDLSSDIDTGYPFWTVEYVYTRTSPAPGTLLDDFIRYLGEHYSAQVRLRGAGYRPCREKDGPFVGLCNLR